MQQKYEVLGMLNCLLSMINSVLNWKNDLRFLTKTAPNYPKTVLTKMKTKMNFVKYSTDNTSDNFLTCNCVL